MKAKLQSLWESIHTSFWFLPAVLTALAIGLSIGIVRVDRSMSWNVKKLGEFLCPAAGRTPGWHCRRLASFLVLICFFHHASNSIEAEQVVDAISRELIVKIDDTFPEEQDSQERGARPPQCDRDEPVITVPAKGPRRSGGAIPGHPAEAGGYGSRIAATAVLKSAFLLRTRVRPCKSAPTLYFLCSVVQLVLATSSAWLRPQTTGTLAV